MSTIQECTFMTCRKPNGKTLKPVIRNTEKGQSAYANKMMRKYGEEVVVTATKYDENYNQKTVCTWSA